MYACMYVYIYIPLSIHPFIDQSFYPSIHLFPICLYKYVFIHQSIHLSIHPCVPPFIHAFTNSSLHLSLCPSIHTSIYKFISPVHMRPCNAFACMGPCNACAWVPVMPLHASL